MHFLRAPTSKGPAGGSYAKKGNPLFNLSSSIPSYTKFLSVEKEAVEKQRLLPLMVANLWVERRGFFFGWLFFAVALVYLVCTTVCGGENIYLGRGWVRLWIYEFALYVNIYRWRIHFYIYYIYN